MLRPTLEQLRGSVPDNLGDPTLISWLLAWAGHAMTTDPTTYYDAPNFWPAPDTLTYADALLPLAAAFGPVYAVTGNWALALNATIVALFMTNLLASYSLVRWLTGSTGVAVVSGLGFGFTTYFMSHLGNTQLLAAAGLPLGLLLLLKVLAQGRTRDALVLGVLTATITLAAAYYAVVWAVMASTVALGWLAVRRRATGAAPFRALLLAAVAAAVCTLPLVAPYLALQSDPAFTRALEPRGGVEIADLLTPAAGSLLYADQAIRPAARGHEFRFFPGLVLSALALVGAAALFGGGARQRDGRAAPTAEVAAERVPRDGLDADRQLGTVLVTAAGGACLLLALGPTVMGHVAPFQLLYERVPGFSGVRVPARLAVGALLAGAVLAGAGLSTLIRRLPPGLQWGTVAVLSVVVLAELARTNTWAPLPADSRTLDVYRALDERPPGAAVELPMVDPAADGAQYPYVEAPRQLYSSLDWHPRVNGYSGYVRPGYSQDVTVLNTFPSPAALRRLRELRVRYVVLHGGEQTSLAELGTAQLQAVVAALPSSAAVSREGVDVLVDLAP